MTILLGPERVGGRSWGADGKTKPQAALPGDLVARLVCIAPWISLLFLMTKLNMSGAVRYLASYYPLLSHGPAAEPGPGRSGPAKLVAVVGALLLRAGRVAAGHFAGQTAVAGGMVLSTLRPPAAVQPAGLARDERL